MKKSIYHVLQKTLLDKWGSVHLYAAGTKQIAVLFDERFIIIFSLYVSIAGAVIYCFVSAFTLAHLVVIPVWKAIPLQALTVKWHWLRGGAISILQFAVCTVNIRWFIAAMATITMPLISSHYNYKEVSISPGSSTDRHLLRETIRTGSRHPQNTPGDYIRATR